jgi:hypothetical protein
MYYITYISNQICTILLTRYNNSGITSCKCYYKYLQIAGTQFLLTRVAYNSKVIRLAAKPEVIIHTAYLAAFKNVSFVLINALIVLTRSALRQLQLSKISATSSHILLQLSNLNSCLMTEQLIYLTWIFSSNFYLTFKLFRLK